MVTRQISNIVDVQERDDFEDLIHDLGRHTATIVTVDVAAEVDVLTMPLEFELLVDAAAANNVELEIATEDPVRQELARIYGLRVATGPDRSPTAIFHEMKTAPIVRSESVRQTPHPVPPTQEFLHVSVPEVNGTHASTPTRPSLFDSDASFSFVIAPPGETFSDKPVARPRRARPKPAAASVSRSLRWSSIVVSAMVVTASIAVLLIALLAPSAEIVIVPESRTVSAEVTYGLEGAGRSLDVAVTPTVLTGTVSYDATVPATGETLVADGTARGMVFVTNPSSEEILLPTGTIFEGPDGSPTYLSTEPIDVPAADPFVSARFGTAVVEVEATEAGPAGNLDVGDLTGTLASGILYQNRFPVEGGTSKAVAVVTEADIEALKAAARQDIASQQASALDEQIPAGWSLVDTPAIVGDIRMEISASAGAVADEVSVVASADVEGSIYDPAALEAAAENRLHQLLASGVPEGFGLEMDSLRTALPRALEDSGSVAFILSADATARAHFDSEFRNVLAGDLVGKGESHAIETLESLQNVSHYTVSYGPEWLPWKPVPRFEERISIDVHGS